MFLTILNMSITASYVIVAIILVRFLLKKTPKIISYVLWGVVGVRLLFPFSIEGVFSLIPFKSDPIPPNVAIPNVSSLETIPNVPVTGYVSTITAHVFNFIEFANFVWIIGIVIMILYEVISFIRLKRSLRGAENIEGNIYELSNLKTPFVIGLFKPKIYLPSYLNMKERAYILLHEQTHIKRHDHIVKLIAYSILCLHWFNPFSWVAFFLMSADMEMSCDERVLKEIGDEFKKDYSMSLLTLAMNKRIISGSPLAFGEGGVKERVKNVLKFNKVSKWIIAIAILAVIGVSIGLVVNPKTKEQRKNSDFAIHVDGQADVPNKYTGNYVWLTKGEPRLQYKKYKVFISAGDNVKTELIGDIIDYAYDEYYNAYQPIYELKGYSKNNYIVTPIMGEVDSYMLFKYKWAKDLNNDIWRDNKS